MFPDLGFGTVHMSADNCPIHMLQRPEPPRREKLDFTQKWNFITSKVMLAAKTPSQWDEPTVGSGAQGYYSWGLAKPEWR